MRVLVCGGRNYSDPNRLFSVLNGLHAERPITAVLHGAARGADSLAAEWARTHGVVPYAYPASWSDISHADAVIRYTKSGRPYDARAGYRRNQVMLDRGKPELVIAFPGGSGTSDMIRRAKAADIRVLKISEKGEL